MKKILLLFFTVTLLSGCGIDYTGSTKLIFEGKLIDAAGAPLEGITVSTHISTNYEDDEISYDTTDKNGHYRMIFPKASDRVNVNVFINNSHFSEVNDPQYSYAQIYNIFLDQIEDYTIDFGTKALYEQANSVSLHLDLQSEGGSGLLKTGVEGMVTDHYIDYNFPVIDNDSDFDDDNAHMNIQSDFLVAKNQVVTVKYLLADGTVNEVQVPIGEENVTYILNY